MRKRKNNWNQFIADTYGGWYTETVKCKHCGYVWVACYPDNLEPKDLQCKNCGMFGAERIKE